MYGSLRRALSSADGDKTIARTKVRTRGKMIERMIYGKSFLARERVFLIKNANVAMTTNPAINLWELNASCLKKMLSFRPIGMAARPARTRATMSPTHAVLITFGTAPFFKCPSIRVVMALIAENGIVDQKRKSLTSKIAIVRKSLQ